MFHSLLNRLSRRSNSYRSRRTHRLGADALEARCTPAAMITIGDVTIVEGHDGTQNAQVEVYVTEPHGNSIGVSYRTVNGSALAGSDFDAVSGRLLFTKKDMSKTILVPIHGDRDIENNELFSIRLSSPKGAKIADGEGLVTIADDEPRISIYDSSIVEGNADTSLMKFTVSLTHAHDLPITVDYNMTDGSALAGLDYIASAGTLTFEENETSQEILVEVIGDRVQEWDKSFTVNLTSSDAVISDSVATGTILDNEPRISIWDSYNYGESTMTFYVNLAMPYDEPVTVDFTTLDGMAIAGVDYVAQAGTLTFVPDGPTTLMITVDVLDPTSAPDKYFYIQLSNPSANATLMNEWATGWWYYDFGWYDGGWWYYDGYYY